MRCHGSGEPTPAGSLSLLLARTDGHTNQNEVPAGQHPGSTNQIFPHACPTLRLSSIHSHLLLSLSHFPCSPSPPHNRQSHILPPLFADAFHLAGCELAQQIPLPIFLTHNRQFLKLGFGAVKVSSLTIWFFQRGFELSRSEIRSIGVVWEQTMVHRFCEGVISEVLGVRAHFHGLGQSCCAI